MAVDGIPVTVPARLGFDLCQVLGDRRAGRAIDHLMNRGLVGVADLETALALLAKRGRDGRSACAGCSMPGASASSPRRAISKTS